jgi:membrane-associated phospholipid phosphatase
MGALTDFGDAAVVLPLSVIILGWLLTHSSSRVAGSWVLAAGLCAVLTTLLKVYLYACSLAPGLVSPSGHSSLSVLVYGAIVVVIAAEQRAGLRAALVVAGAIWIAAIAGSRIWLNAHSLPEVAIGVVIGSAALALFAARYLRFRDEGRRLRPLILCIIVITATLHGQEIRVEALLQAISRDFHLASVACVA